MNAPTKRFSTTQAGVSQTAENIADTARDAVEAVKTKVGDAVGDAMDRGQAAVSYASDAASQMTETATHQVKTFASELEAVTKRNPLGAIAGAVVVGLVLGLWAHGRSS